ncbi:MAG: LuxR C-terminal-related transcriptional regulator [Chitinispirillaceae bacterium]
MKNPLSTQSLCDWLRSHPVDPDLDKYRHLIIEQENRLRFPLPSTQFYYIMDIKTGQMLYVSESIRHVLGYDPYDLNDLEMFYEAVHPQDLSLTCLAVFKSLSFAYKFRDTLPMEGMFSMDCRVRHRQGHWVRIKRDNSLYRRDRFGNPALTITWCTDITSYKQSSIVTFDYKGPSYPGLVFPDDELLEAGRILTPREIEIIRHIANGDCSKEIADALNLSVHTVHTHRRRMLKKINANNSHQLIRFAQEHNLL